MNFLYDTSYFLSTYYNESVCINKNNMNNPQTAQGFEYYQEVKGSIKNLPEGIAPFFYSPDPEKNFWIKNVSSNIQNIILEETSEYLKNKTELKDQLILFFFPDISDFDYMIITSGTDDFYTLYNVYKKLFKRNELPDHLLVPFLLVSTAFSRLLKELEDTLVHVYNEINNLAEKHSQEISILSKSAGSEKSLIEFMEANDFKPNDSTEYIISLIDPYCLKADKTNNVIYAGIHYSEKIINDTYRNVNIINFCKIMNSQVALSIFNLFLSKPGICAEDIMKETGYGITYIYKHLALFSREKIITLVKNEGKVKFYSLNKKYFNHLAKEISLL